MDSTQRIKAMNMTELLPHLGGAVSKDTMRTLSAKEPPRSATAVRIKPLTIAEMKAEMGWPFNQSPRRIQRVPASTKKKWNSSVKVQNKVISHTVNGQMKHNSVKKLLDFQQPKPKDQKMCGTSSRMTMVSTVTPKFPKPEKKVTKFKTLAAGKPVRISGISHIPETPLTTNKPVFKSRMTLSNKENISIQGARKIPAVTPKLSLHKQLLPSRIPDTPMSFQNSSIGDASFLLNEQAVERTQDLGKESEDEVPPMSTPYRKYRNFRELFNASSDDGDCSTHQDDTIMCFNETLKEKREESVIGLLCDKFRKANVNNSDVNENCDIADILEIIKQTENSINMIDNHIKSLETIKQSQLKSLQCMKKLLQEKYKANNNEKTSNKISNNAVVQTTIVSSPTRVIKSCLKSPSYKIPKRTTPVMKKKVFYKSAPNVSNLGTTPVKMGGKALSMYMKMKENMQFLNTPAGKQRACKPNTPTSHNLQKQLDKLYNQS